jgi:hypothetical protein
VFVGTPDHKTLFVGIYSVSYRGLLEHDRPAPHIEGQIERAGKLDVYDLTLETDESALGDLIGRLCVDWGEERGKGRGGEKVWVQYADRHDKPITEVLAEPVSRPGLRASRRRLVGASRRTQLRSG